MESRKSFLTEEKNWEKIKNPKIFLKNWFSSSSKQRRYHKIIDFISGLRSNNDRKQLRTLFL